MGRRRNKKSSTVFAPVNQKNMMLGIFLEGGGNKKPFDIYRQWGDNIAGDYKNLRLELLEKNVPWDKVHEVTKRLRDAGR